MHFQDSLPISVSDTSYGLRFSKLNTLAVHAIKFTLLAISMLIFSPAHSQETPTELPVTQLSIGIHLIKAEVAARPEEREKGLMRRVSMGSNQGMVFLFEQPATVCMWMKNTLIPLSVAFIGDNGTILNIEDMQPQTETNHCTVKPAVYALEMNLGWFAKRGIKAGSKISGLPRLQ